MCNFMPAVRGVGRRRGAGALPPALKSTQEGEVYMIKLSDEREIEGFPRSRKLYDDVLTKI